MRDSIAATSGFCAIARAIAASSGAFQSSPSAHAKAETRRRDSAAEIRRMARLPRFGPGTFPGPPDSRGGGSQRRNGRGGGSGAEAPDAGAMNRAADAGGGGAGTTKKSGAAAARIGLGLASARETGSGERPTVVSQSPQQEGAAETERGTGAAGQQSPQAPSDGPARRASATMAAATDLMRVQYLIGRDDAPASASENTRPPAGLPPDHRRVSLRYSLRCRSASAARPSFSARVAALKWASALPGSRRVAFW